MTHQPLGFTTPSGNIGCSETNATLVCSILAHTFVATNRPSGCPAAQWGGQLVLGHGSPALEFRCDQPTSLPSAPVLAYGQTIIGSVTGCTSSTTGLTCWLLDGSVGFTLHQSGAVELPGGKALTPGP